MNCFDHMGAACRQVLTAEQLLKREHVHHHHHHQSSSPRRPGSSQSELLEQIRPGPPEEFSMWNRTQGPQNPRAQGSKVLTALTSDYLSASVVMVTT